MCIRDSLTEAVALLSASPAGYELALALAALGTERGDRDLLARAADTARQCGADGLERSTSEALRTLGGTAPRAAAGVRAWEDGLTGEELRVAELAARDDPAARDRDLSPVYRKLGTDRRGLADALAAFTRGAK